MRHPEARGTTRPFQTTIRTNHPFGKVPPTETKWRPSGRGLPRTTLTSPGAGYDVLNEPNWNLPGGTALRALYEQCTDSIREVDTQHLLFFEGTGSPTTSQALPRRGMATWPTPHKYWSNNDAATLEFALALRDTYQVPLYFGKPGELQRVVPRCRALVGRFGHRLGMVAVEKSRAFPPPCPSKRPPDIKHS